MANVFDIDLSKALTDFERLKKVASEVGGTLDEVENTAASFGNMITEQLNFAKARFDALTKSSTEVHREMKQLSQLTAATKFLENIENSAYQAALKSQALADSTNAAGHAMRNTAGANLMSEAHLKVATSTSRAKAEQITLAHTLETLNSRTVANNASTKLQISHREKARDNLSRLNAETQLYKKLTEDLLSPEAQANREARTGYEIRRLQADVRTQLTEAQAKAEVQEQKLSNEEHKATLRLQEKNKALEKVLRMEAQQAAQVQVLQKQIELAGTADAKHIEQLKRKLIELQSTQKVESEHTKVLKEKASAVAKLQAEVEYLRSAEGQRHTALANQLNEEKRKILETSEAHKRKQKQLRISNQLTAAWRASLQGLSSSIGMFTSATILTASAVYGVSRALRETLTVGKEFNYEMSMAQAVMGATNAQFSGVEQQVRTLGQTTIFTASEVAKAATELGLAGLTTGQAIAALRPTLDLATIGALEMGRAADHATNVMMTFELGVKDLTKVVDVMATAVTNSNTNIDQLANALTYAGPAAQTAGYSIEETTAAIASLANQGIKASRAGTALRRLFVNLHNPTAKGKKVLEEYNIQVSHLDGSARSLEDVLGQLAHAFNSLAGPDKLKAVQDLVGVYATSTISALISANDQFELLNNQMIMASGNAEKMREQLEQAFEFDWREVKSAFQEIQLLVFDDTALQMQVYMKELTVSLLELTQVGEDGFSSLDTAIDFTSKGLKALSVLVAAGALRWLVLRSGIAQSTVAMGANVKAGALKARMIATINHEILKGAGLESAYAGALARTTGAMVAQTAAARALAVAKALVMGPAGVANLVALAGTAYLFRDSLRDIFVSKEIEEGMSEHAHRVHELEKRYSAASRAASMLQATQEARTVQSQLASGQTLLGDQKAALAIHERELKALQDKNKRHREAVKLVNEGVQARLEEEEQWTASDEAALNSHRNLVTFYKDAITKGEEELKLLKVKAELTSGDLKTQRELTAQHGTLTAELTRQTIQLEKLEEQRDKDQLWGKSTEKLQKQIAQASQEVTRLRGQLSSVNVELDMLSSKVAVAPLMESFAVSMGQLAKSWEDTSTTHHQKLQQVNGQITDIVRQMEELNSEQDEHGRLTGEQADQWEKLAGALLRFMGVRKQLMDDGEKIRMDNEKLLADYDFSGLDAAVQQKRIAEELAQVRARIAELRADENADQEELNRHLKREVQLRGQVRVEKEKVSRDRDLEQAVRMYDQLLKAMDPVAHAKRDHAEKLEQLALLYKKAEITAEEYEAAVRQLNKELREATTSQEKYLEQYHALQDKYYGSWAKDYIKDLGEINQILKSGVITQDEYAEMRDKIMEKAGKETADFGLESRVGVELTPNSGVFHELLKMSVDIAKAEAEWDRFVEGVRQQAEIVQTQLSENFLREMAELDRQYEAKELSEEEHQIRMKELQEKYKRDAGNATELLARKEEAIRTETMEREKEHRLMLMSSAAGSMAAVLGMIADAGEDATAAQKVAFVAQKALAIAQIIMDTEAGAARAIREAGPTAGQGLANMIRAQGYASAGLVAALSIGELSGGSKPKNSNFAGAYDKGGYVPTGKFGIVGEYGPEIVNGPAHVTGREATARKLGGGGDNITISPVINIDYQTEGGESPADQQRSANMLAGTIEAVVVKTLARELRPNGMLSRR